MLLAVEKMTLMVKVLHHLTATFKEHAVLTGGMELSLFSSERYTNDLDFIFVPFKSKKDIVADVERCLRSLDSTFSVLVSLSSKNAKFIVKSVNAEIEVEISVAQETDSVPMNTQVLASKVNLPTQIIRVMRPEVALAHKLAAWSERRLLRDIYDAYYWFGVLGFSPDIATLILRLNAIQSRIPQFRTRKKMTVPEFCHELRVDIKNITQNLIDTELSSLPESGRLGLELNLKAQMFRLTSEILTRGI